MARYHVHIDTKATVAQGSEALKVIYDAPDYNDAWVGARSVCRYGTFFEADGAKGGQIREFFFPDGEPCRLKPGVYTVRQIFAEKTRKTGKQRMTVLTSDDLLALMTKRNLTITPTLQQALEEAMKEGGLRITVAQARRLGIDVTPQNKEAS